MRFPQTSVRSVLVGAAIAVAGSGPALAQADTTVSGASFAVSLLTIGTGPLVGQRFGHTVFRIRDAARGTDQLYSYGILPHGAGEYLAQLLQGRLRQRVKVFDAGQMLARYERHGRSVWEQRLALTPAQRAGLLDALDRLASADAASLPFDYYLDNCSTRPRDVLDSILGGAIRRQLRDVPDGTLRQHAGRYGVTDVVFHTSLQILQGREIDRPASAWEAMFLPERLRHHLGDVTIRVADGSDHPLVQHEELLLRGLEVPAEATDRLVEYVAAGAAFGVVVLLLGLVRPVAAPGRRRLPFVVLAAGWHTATGVIGVLLLVLWSATAQHAAQGNANLLVLNPVSLVLAALLVSGRGAAAGRRLAAALAGASLAAVLLHVLPGATQANAEVLALTVPPHLAMAAVMLLRGDRVSLTHPGMDRAPLEGDRSPAPAER